MDNDYALSSRSSPRLAQSAYHSPYTRAGAPTPHPNSDPYTSLRRQALATLESMGYDPETMTERGVKWGEDLEPYDKSQYMAFLGTCFHRITESHDKFLSDEEYNNMTQRKTVFTKIKNFELQIRRGVRYPDSVSTMNKHDGYSR
jgi:hypothetical protein